MNVRRTGHRWLKYMKKRGRAYRRMVHIAWGKGTYRFRKADITIFHDFKPPPTGGGSQFLRALWSEWERRGIQIENNIFSHTTRACLFNSYNFDFDRLRRWHDVGFRMAHRIDGPIRVYRGWDDGTDARIQQINTELADVTIFQSQYSLQKSLEIGLRFNTPVVIMNAVNPRIFHPHDRYVFDRGRKIRLISTSWSDNPNKGGETYRWLEDHLDWERFEYTFVGRSPVQFQRIRMINPVPPEQIAHLLRQHDIYITASQHEACSNSVLEALACGLPVVYLKSGANSEIVGQAGLGFAHQEEIPEILERVADDYEKYQSRIVIPTLSEVADQYLAAMGLNDFTNVNRKKAQEKHA